VIYYLYNNVFNINKYSSCLVGTFLYRDVSYGEISLHESGRSDITCFHTSSSPSVTFNVRTNSNDTLDLAGCVNFTTCSSLFSPNVSFYSSHTSGNPYAITTIYFHSSFTTRNRLPGRLTCTVWSNGMVTTDTITLYLFGKFDMMHFFA
jgi:hypothetical protein